MTQLGYKTLFSKENENKLLSKKQRKETDLENSIVSQNFRTKQTKTIIIYLFQTFKNSNQLSIIIK